ncbi:MAG: peptidyl-prolyl cis-trans isomerase [Myxococcota bacterium]
MDRETNNSSMRLIREPVVHFVLIGVAIFALDYAMQPERAPDEIVVGERTVERMRSEFETRHGKAPDTAQTKALIDAHVREEVLYREALALGLHRSDPIVRRRMVQAMEFLSEDLAPIADPTDAQLQAYLDAHADEFRKPARVSLQHIFFAEGDDAEQRARAALEQIEGGASVGQMGDAFVHGSTMKHADRRRLAAAFGDGFADAVMGLADGAWRGPVESKYGVHLVYVQTRKPAGQPELDEVRARVEAAWRQAEREDVNREAVERLRESYSVQVEWNEASE